MSSSNKIVLQLQELKHEVLLLAFLKCLMNGLVTLSCTTSVTTTVGQLDIYLVYYMYVHMIVVLYSNTSFKFSEIFCKHNVPKKYHGIRNLQQIDVS
jgi:hypothetical protein